MTDLSQAAYDVIAERRRQTDVEDWTPQHDDEHEPGDLATAASAYVYHAAKRLNPYHAGEDEEPEVWPMRWSIDWWKPTVPRRDLVKAAALIIAEIERMDRADLKAAKAIMPEAEVEAQLMEGKDE